LCFVLFVFVLCTICYQFPWIVYFFIAPSVFSNAYITDYNRLLILYYRLLICFNTSLICYNIVLLCYSRWTICYTRSQRGEWMYVIIGNHFVQLERKFLLIALDIVRITLNVIVSQIPLNVRKTTVCPSIKNVLSNSQILRQCYFHLLRKRW